MRIRVRKQGKRGDIWNTQIQEEDRRRGHLKGNLSSQEPSALRIETPAAAAAAKSSVVSDSVRLHRRQLTRLPHPWDFPGKNTGVGCHTETPANFQILRLAFLQDVYLIFCSPFGSQVQKFCSINVSTLLHSTLSFYFILFLKLFLFFYLAALGLICSMQDLCLWHVGSLLEACKLLVAACRTEFPGQGLNPGPLHSILLTTGPPRKSLIVFFSIPSSILIYSL